MSLFEKSQCLTVNVLIAGDSKQSTKLDVKSEPIVCPASELCLYSGDNLAAIVQQLKTQMSRDDPNEQFKVSRWFDL